MYNNIIDKKAELQLAQNGAAVGFCFFRLSVLARTHPGASVCPTDQGQKTDILIISAIWMFYCRKTPN